MNSSPLVSVICLCYNHERFVEEALRSVLEQDYPNMEIIVVDDCSTDGSVAKIRTLQQQYPKLEVIENKENLGNCKAFNKGFRHAAGTFLVDFSTDDVMLPQKIQKQVQRFLSLDERYGVVYSDAEIIDEGGRFLGYHHQGTARADYHPEGDVFKEVLQKYFISPPTMMFRRSILSPTQGYDERLAYEDFNFWITSARAYYYAFVPEALVQRRVVAGSLSASFFTVRKTAVFETTQIVLKKAFELCRTESEQQVWIQRVRFELKHATMMEQRAVASEYGRMLQRIGKRDFFSKLLLGMNALRLPLFWLYKPLLWYKGFYSVR
jgi:glycosyltransferase involved in cell wall biosynthesis